MPSSAVREGGYGALLYILTTHSVLWHVVLFHLSTARWKYTLIYFSYFKLDDHTCYRDPCINILDDMVLLLQPRTL